MKEELKAGFGCACMRFSSEYFEYVGDNGVQGHLDGFNGKTHSFQGSNGLVIDDLMTRVLVLEAGIRTAIVSLDIAQAPEDQVAYTKKIVGETCNIAEENVWVHVTHQFGFMHRMGQADKE